MGKKRKHGHGPQNSPPENENLESAEMRDERELIVTFERMEDILCDLLSSASPISDLTSVLGEHKATFVTTLQSMISRGSIPWIQEVYKGGEEPGKAWKGKEKTDAGVLPSGNPVSPIPEFPGLCLDRDGDSDMLTIPPLIPACLQPHPPPSPPPPPPPPPLPCHIPYNPHPHTFYNPWPPPLPPIPDAALRLQALTPDSVANAHLSHAHYQRLEWLGDAYLEVAISRILHDRFPHAREGILTDVRRTAVTNKKLSSLAAEYGFENMITSVRNLPPRIGGVSKAQVYWKTLADCFEAYIAAVAISYDDGLKTLMAWLGALYEPEMQQLLKAYPSRLSGQANVRSKPNFSLPVIPHSQRVRPARRGRSASRMLVPRSQPAPDDSDWEEMDEPLPRQSERLTRLDSSAKLLVRRLVPETDVSLTYTLITSSSSHTRGEDNRDRLRVGIFLTGWGWHQQELACGWGSTEFRAGIRAAQNALCDKNLPQKLERLRKGNPATMARRVKRQGSVLAVLPPRGPRLSPPPLAAMSPVLEELEEGEIMASWNKDGKIQWEEKEGIIMIYDD